MPFEQNPFRWGSTTPGVARRRGQGRRTNFATERAGAEQTFPIGCSRRLPGWRASTFISRLGSGVGRDPGFAPPTPAPSGWASSPKMASRCCVTAGAPPLSSCSRQQEGRAKPAPKVVLFVLRAPPGMSRSPSGLYLFGHVTVLSTKAAEVPLAWHTAALNRRGAPGNRMQTSLSLGGTNPLKRSILKWLRV